MSVTDRFIAEFNADAVQAVGLPVGSPDGHPVVRAQHLAAHDQTGYVYVYATLNLDGHEAEVMVDTIVFDPEEPASEAIDRLVELLHLDYGDAQGRLAAIGVRA